MKKSLLSSLLHLLLLLFASVNIVLGSTISKDGVVILHSYHQGFRWTDNINDGINTVFDTQADSINFELFVEYLDAKRYNDSSHFKLVKEALKNKFQNINTLLVITSDDIAFQFAINNREDLFNNAPVVFCGVNHLPSYKTSLLKNKSNYTGVIEAFDLKGTLDLAFQFHPKAKKVYVINDNTSTGKQNKKALDEAIAEAGYKTPFFYLTDFPVSNIDTILNELDKNSFILLMSYNQDAAGNYFDYVDIGKIISNATDIPVYVVWDFYMGTGVVGGRVLSGKSQGKQAALMGIEVLKGKSTDSIPIDTKSPNVYMFDYQELKILEIQKNELPKDYTLVNLPDTFWAKYFKEIVFVLSVLSLLVLAIIILLIGIKNKTKAEKSLKASKLKLTTILQTAKEGFVEFDAQGKIKQVNKELCLILNTSAEKIINSSLFNALKVESTNQKHNVFTACFQGTPTSFEYQVNTDSQTIKYLNINATPLFNDENEVSGGFALISDISNQKRFEQELIEAKEKAEKSDKLKSAFLANMSHEIRTPMNAILGFSELLNDETLEKDRKKLFLETIHTSGKNLLSLINDILDLSKIEAEELDLVFEDIELHKLVSEIHTSFSETKQFQDKADISFVVVSPEKDLNIITDPLRVTQIITNLLNNAFKFTDEGQIKLETRVVDEDTVEFKVEDTGIGIPAEKIKLIFNRFSKIDDSATQLYNGAGLGLAISKNLVEMLGGEIWVESTEGQGTAFFFTIKGKIFKKERQITDKNKIVDYTQKLKNKHILLAEDNLDNALIIKELLNKHKVKLTIVNTGEQAVNLVTEKKNFDLVLMDIYLPDIDGITATEKIKQFKSDIPVIAVTTKAKDEEEEKALAAGCDLYLIKPVNHQLLLSSLAHLV